jgi:hypothetical protein
VTRSELLAIDDGEDACAFGVVSRRRGVGEKNLDVRGGAQFVGKSFRFFALTLIAQVRDDLGLKVC